MNAIVKIQSGPECGRKGILLNKHNVNGKVFVRLQDHSEHILENEEVFHKSPVLVDINNIKVIGYKL